MYIPLFIGNKLKSWPLYLFVTISVFLWVAMTLYEDKIDKFCLNKFDELEPLYVSIYVCIKNFLHGFCLFIILVLLAHLSDIENRFELDSTRVESFWSITHYDKKSCFHNFTQSAYFMNFLCVSSISYRPTGLFWFKEFFPKMFF